MSTVPHPVIAVPGGMGSKLFDHRPRPNENWFSMLRIIVRNIISRLLDPTDDLFKQPEWNDPGKLAKADRSRVEKLQ